MPRGRPKGSKNKSNVDVSGIAADSGIPQKQVSSTSQQPRKRGRPKGSKNVLVVSSAPAAKKPRGRPPKNSAVVAGTPTAPPKPRGRPKGSKNIIKPTTQSGEVPDADAPKRRGRPKGSKNKVSTEDGMEEETGLETDVIDSGIPSSDFDDGDGLEDEEDVQESGMEEDGDDEDGGGVWDLKRAISQSDDTKNGDTSNGADGSDDPQEDSAMMKCMCRKDGCEDDKVVAIWTNSNQPHELYYVCEPCQMIEFGGWPEESDGGDDGEEEEEAGVDRVVDSPGLGAADSNKTGDEESEEEEEGLEWELKKIHSIETILNEPILCKVCTVLPSCSVYYSKEEKPKRYEYCLDCQDEDFGGWPENPKDLPIQYMSTAHKYAIVSKCSRQSNPSMPDFLLPSPTSDQQAKDPSVAGSNDKSPVPIDSCTNIHKRSSEGIANFVTPPPNSDLPLTDKKLGNGKIAAAATVTSAKTVSKGAIAAHKKWQDDATKLGGPNAKIVVKKLDAKQLIFDLLYEAFRPMNITQIYEALKAVVPKPVLSTCLQDMSYDKKHKGNQFAEDSDDDGDGGTDDMKSDDDKDAKEPFAGSLCFKVGKNQGTHLYFVNHNKLTPISFDERSELLNKLANARAEEDALKATLKDTMDLTARLLSEPTNEEAVALLETGEAQALEMKAALEEARKLQVNQQHKVKTKRSIDHLAAHWRIRKRLCMDFLINLEENTDGSVQAKKCLSGDGQIALDSDENVAKAAIRMIKDKRARMALLNNRGGGAGKKMGKSSKMSGGAGTSKGGKAASLADENFVAVNLDSQNSVCRIYVDDEEQTPSLFRTYTQDHFTLSVI